MATYGEIFVQVVSEASGKPVSQVRNIPALAQAMAGKRGGLDDPLSEEEAEALLAKLRREMPGIRAWLAEGAQRVENRSRAEGRNRAARRAARFN